MRKGNMQQGGLALAVHGLAHGIFDHSCCGADIEGYYQPRRTSSPSMSKPAGEGEGERDTAWTKGQAQFSGCSIPAQTCKHASA